MCSVFLCRTFSKLDLTLSRRICIWEKKNIFLQCRLKKFKPWWATVLYSIYYCTADLTMQKKCQISHNLIPALQTFQFNKKQRCQIKRKKLLKHLLGNKSNMNFFYEVIFWIKMMTRQKLMTLKWMPLWSLLHICKACKMGICTQFIGSYLKYFNVCQQKQFCLNFFKSKKLSVLC